VNNNSGPALLRNGEIPPTMYNCPCPEEGTSVVLMVNAPAKALIQAQGTSPTVHLPLQPFGHERVPPSSASLNPPNPVPSATAQGRSSGLSRRRLMPLTIQLYNAHRSALSPAIPSGAIGPSIKASGASASGRFLTASSGAKPAPKRNPQVCHRGRTVAFTLWICAFVTSHQLSPLVVYLPGPGNGSHVRARVNTGDTGDKSENKALNTGDRLVTLVTVDLALSVPPFTHAVVVALLEAFPLEGPQASCYADLIHLSP
jgi:hypothetical protein